MQKTSDTNNYLDDLKEYQDKQYLPGYYVGGKLPLALKYPTRRLGWVFLVFGLFMAVVLLIAMITGGSSDSWLSTAENIGLPTVFLVLYVLIGLRLITKKRPE